jgi:DNA-binding LytR/AlgR family response regulator
VGSDLLAISAEDHYVRVHAAAGSQLLLMRFADAVAEVEDLPGVRAHRSWWVARDAIVGAIPNGRQMKLQLANGLAVPVARAAAPLIKQIMEEVGVSRDRLEPSLSRQEADVRP